MRRKRHAEGSALTRDKSPNPPPVSAPGHSLCFLFERMELRYHGGKFAFWQNFWDHDRWIEGSIRASDEPFLVFDRREYRQPLTSILGLVTFHPGYLSFISVYSVRIPFHQDEINQKFPWLSIQAFHHLRHRICVYPRAPTLLGHRLIPLTTFACPAGRPWREFHLSKVRGTWASCNFPLYTSEVRSRNWPVLPALLEYFPR
jgi:hypothetical protein